MIRELIVIPPVINPHNAEGIWPQCSVFWVNTQAGLLEGFEESDPIFPTSNGARRWACEQSVKQHTEIYPAAYGVWDVDSGELMAIFYLGSEYT